MEKAKTSLFLVAVVAVWAMYVPAWATDGMVSYWRFDEETGTIAYDSFDDNHGTIYGAQWTTGIVDGALSFNGNDYVNVGNMGAFPTEGTIEFWMYEDQFEDCENPFATNIDVENVNVIRFEESPSTFYVVVGGAGYSVYNYITSSPPQGWHHVVLVWNSGSSNIKGYLNNVKKFDTSHSNWPTTMPNVQIGRGYRSTLPKRYFSGLIDEVAIYNRALCALEIQQHYQDGLSGYGYSVHPELFAICKIELAIAEKVEALERIDTAIAKEWAAYDALEEFLAGGDYGDLNRSDIIRAKQNIFAAIQQQEQSKNALERSLQKLQDSLWLLGAEVQP